MCACGIPPHRIWIGDDVDLFSSNEALTEPPTANFRTRGRERSVRPLVLIDVRGASGDHDREQIRRRYK